MRINFAKEIRDGENNVYSCSFERKPIRSCKNKITEKHNSSTINVGYAECKYVQTFIKFKNVNYKSLFLNKVLLTLQLPGNKVIE